MACIKLNVWYDSMDVHSSESEMVQRSKRASNFQVPGSGVRSSLDLGAMFACVMCTCSTMMQQCKA